MNGGSRAAPPWTAYASLAGAMALVGAYVGLSKLLVTVLPVFLLAWLRFGIAAVAMGHWLRPAAGDAPLGPGERRLLFFESFFGNFLFSVCMLFGMARSTALAAGVILAAIPAAVALLSWIALGERIQARTLAGMVCAVAGIALVSVVGPAHGAAGSGADAPLHPWIGNLLLVGAVCCEASYVVMGKRLTATVSPRRISALVNLWGLLLVTPFGAWQAARFDFSSVPADRWGLLLFYALAASMWSVWLWMRGLRHVPAASAGVFTVVLPVSAAAVGVLCLGERVSAAQVAAFALALLGIVLATWPARTSALAEAGA